MRASIVLAISALIVSASSGGVLVAQTRAETPVAILAAAEDESMAGRVTEVQRFGGRSLEADDETIGLNMSAVTLSRIGPVQSYGGRSLEADDETIGLSMSAVTSSY